MKNFIRILFIFCMPFFSYAQMNGQVKGEVQDNKGDAIAYATISLFDAQEKLLQGTITDEHGHFEFKKLPLDSLKLMVQFLGFLPYENQIVLNKKTKKINLGIIKLNTDHQQLDEVVVTAEQSSFNLQLDKKVFNVGKDVLSQGASATDVLDQVPSVSVDPNGTVSLRGNSNVQILINGRRSGLTMNNALEQLPSDNIERVEVITNPSARFDANGSAGIINIILKKNKNEGFSGQISTAYGIPANHIILPSLNYRGAKINAFSNFRWRYSDYNGEYSTQQEVEQDGKKFFLNSNEDEDRHDDGRSAYIGADYFINDRSSFTLAYFRAETKDSDTTVLAYDLQEDELEPNRILRTGSSVENRNYNQLESNYTYNFKKKGQRLSVDFQYDFWNSEKDWLLSTSGSGVPDFVDASIRTNTKSGSRDAVVQLDYSQPLQKNNSFEIGAKLENRIVKNDYLAESFIDNNWKTYNDIDNDVDYIERVGAAYFQYKGKLKKLEYMAGLRAEYTFLEVEDQENEFTDQTEYFNLFPSVFLSYPLAQNKTIQWSYSKRINRPNLWSLYPFFEIKDFNLQRTGNPNLQPAFTDALEIAFLSVSEKFSFNPVLYYRHSESPISDFVAQNVQGTFISLPINIDRQSFTGLELSMKYQPLRVFNISSEFNLFHFDRRGTFQGINLDNKGTTWSARINANFNLPKGFRIQSRFEYWAPERYAQTKELSAYSLNFGISKSFFNDKLNINLRGVNVLNSRVLRTITEANNFRIESRGQRIGPRYAIGILYRFNPSKKSQMRRQKRGNR